MIFADNGSEFSGRLLDLWAYHHGVQIDFSRPGKPTDNCFVETFNGSLRDECLNVHWFESLDEAKAKIEAWRSDYNESRPHQALGRADAVRIRREDEGLGSIDGHRNRRKLTLHLVRETQAVHEKPFSQESNGPGIDLQVRGVSDQRA